MITSMLNASIIIPTYNRANFLGRAINSVLNEMIPGDELIVIDDGSTDNTHTIIRPYLSKIKYIRTPNYGAGSARNRGINEAINPLIAFLDSDDEWLPGKLIIQRNILNKFSDILYVFSDFSVKNKRDQIIKNYLKNWHMDQRTWEQILGGRIRYSTIAPIPIGQTDFYVYVGDLYAAEMKNNYIGTFTLVYRRENVTKSVRFSEDLPTFEDWEFFGRLTREGNGAYVDYDLAMQYGHEGPRLTDTDDLKTLTSRIAILERVWGKDERFLLDNRAQYNKTLDNVRCERINVLLREGRYMEAKSDILLLNETTSLYNALAVMPNEFFPLLLKGYGVVKNILKKTR